jgi:membrane protein YfhO
MTAVIDPTDSPRAARLGRVAALFATGPREAVAIALLMALVLVAAFPRVIVGHATFAPGAQIGTESGVAQRDYPYPIPSRAVVNDGGAFAWQFEPWAIFTHDAYADGHVPLWDPYSALGKPFAGNLQSAPFSPLYAPVFLHPGQRVWDFVFLLRLWLGGLGCYALLRALGSRPLVALGPAVAYMLATTFVLWTSSVSMNVEPLAPWLLLALLLGLRRPTAPRFALLAVVVAAILVGGQPEVAIVLGWVGAVWAVVFWVRGPRRARPLIEVAGAAACGALIASPQLLLALEYVPIAAKGHYEGLGNNLYPIRTGGVMVLGDFAAKHQAAIGIVLSSLALAALAARRRLLPGTLVLLAVSAVWVPRAFDVPLVSSLMRHLPGIGTINARRYGELLPVLCAALLAAAVVEAAVRRVRAVAVVPAAFAGVTLVAWALGAGSRTDMAWATVLAALVAATLFLTAYRPILAPLIVIVVFVQFLGLAPRTYARPNNTQRVQPFMRYLQSHLNPGERAAGGFGLVEPEWAGAFGVADPNSRDALYPGRWSWYMKHLVGHLRLGPEQLASPFLDALAVRYVVTPRGAAMPATYTRVMVDRDGRRLAVWENTQAFPGAWLAKGVVAARTRRGAELRLKASNGDLRQLTVIEDPTPEMARATGTGTARVTSYSVDESTVDVDVTGGSGVLVVPQQFFPGWKASVDGSSTPIRAANSTMRAVSVPSGRHTVTFTYEPARWRYGLILAALGVLAIAARCLAPLLRRRRGGGRPATGGAVVL